jgi:Xaa-Pro aminopeptidase
LAAVWRPEAPPCPAPLPSLNSPQNTLNPTQNSPKPTPSPNQQSEYPPDCDARRAFVSGFDGSAGTAVVTADRAALWTDGRYFLQAEQQLGPAWTLMRAGAPGVPEIHDWLAAEVPAGGAIGVDAALHTAEGGERLAAALADVGARLVRLAPNPVDAAWGAARPARPSAPARVHALEWAGAAPAEKLAALRGELAGAGAGAIVVAGLGKRLWGLNAQVACFLS